MFSAKYVESLETMLANLGTDLSTVEVPVFMSRVIDALQTEENKSEKQWPDGINKALILESSLSNPFVSQVMKHTWLAYVRKDEEILSKHIE